MDDAQLQALVEQWRKQLDRQMTDMKLRQWCVEKAIEAAARAPIEASGIRSPVVVYDVPTLAKAILEFVSAPFSDVFRDDPRSPPE